MTGVNSQPPRPNWGPPNKDGGMMPSSIEVDITYLKIALEYTIMGVPVIVVPAYMAWLSIIYYLKYYSKNKTVSGDIKKVYFFLKNTVKNWSYILDKGKKEIPLSVAVMFLSWYLWLSGIIIPASKVGLASLKVQILIFYFTPFLLPIIIFIAGIWAKKTKTGIIFKINKKIPNYKKALYFFEIIVLLSTIIVIYWVYINIC